MSEPLVTFFQETTKVLAAANLDLLEMRARLQTLASPELEEQRVLQRLTQDRRRTEIRRAMAGARTREEALGRAARARAVLEESPAPETAPRAQAAEPRAQPEPALPALAEAVA